MTSQSIWSYHNVNWLKFILFILMNVWRKETIEMQCCCWKENLCHFIKEPNKWLSLQSSMYFLWKNKLLNDFRSELKLLIILISIKIRNDMYTNDCLKVSTVIRVFLNRMYYITNNSIYKDDHPLNTHRIVT